MRSAAAACLLAGCVVGCTVPPDALPDSPVQVDGAAPSADAWTVEAFESQPQMIALTARTPVSTGFDPGTTPWTRASAVPSDGGATTPGGLLADVIAAAGWSEPLGDAMWEQTTRIWNDSTDTATGIVLQWGFQDDAVAGRDFRVRMRRTGDRWQVEHVDERHHCRRRVSAEGLCA